MILSPGRKGAPLFMVALLTLALLPFTTAFADSGKTEAKTAAHPPVTTMAPMKANGSGVVVQYRIDGTPQVGAATPVVLTLDHVTDPAGASLRLQPEGGLALGGGTTTIALPSGVPTTLTIDVTPSVEGVGYIHVFTTQYGATSATSIPIQVGNAPSAKPSGSDLKQSPNGEKIRSMQVK